MFSEAMRFSSSSVLWNSFWNRVESGFSTSGGAEGSYGLLPLIWGTLMVSAIALLVAVPIGLLIAIYLAEYASPGLRSRAKPTIEILAGIPTIVYGVFALMVIGPFFKMLGDTVGLHINATSALTAGFVMGIMIIPFVSSLSDDIITRCRVHYRTVHWDLERPSLKPFGRWYFQQLYPELLVPFC